MRLYRIFLFCTLLLTGLGVLAHGSKPGRPVTGIVTDDYGHPLVGVLVTVKGQTASTVSGQDGVFHIAADTGAILLDRKSVV